MKTIIETQHRYNGRMIAGALIVIIGTLLLVDQLNLVFFPDWLFNWPLILIGIGLYVGVKHNFQNWSWMIWIGVGLAYMLDDALPGLNAGDYIWPGAIILVGIYLIVRHGEKRTIAG